MKPLQQIVYLDWSDFICPCGDEISGRFKTDKEIDDFIRAHKKHTNGKISEVWDPSGALKVCTSVPGPFERDIL